MYCMIPVLQADMMKRRQPSERSRMFFTTQMVPFSRIYGRRIYGKTVPGPYCMTARREREEALILSNMNTVSIPSFDEDGERNSNPVGESRRVNPVGESRLIKTQ